jgi:hypothetical protein
MIKNFYSTLLFLIFALGFYQSNAQCNWASQKPYAYFWDTCTSSTSSNSVNGYVAFKASTSCFKYEWTVDSVTVSHDFKFHHAITKNGTYSVCVKVTDTCNNCDTTFCSSRTITCFSNSTSTCNWASRNGTSIFWDSCASASKTVNGYISFNANSCFKYHWSVNGVKVKSEHAWIYYPITKNGVYEMCVNVEDTCNNCDTTFCGKRTITCFSSSSSCNFSKAKPTSIFWDSCTSTSKSANGYVSFNGPSSCFKYQWYVNGSKVGDNHAWIYYPITKNGVYEMCLKVEDTCNNCDTSFCGKRTVTCFNSSKCNWASRNPNKLFWDSCTKTSQSIHGYVSFNSSSSCFKYQWFVNGDSVGQGNQFINFEVKHNGNYELCVKVTDTCNDCDTMFCSKRTITCFSTSKCNWMLRKPTVAFWDTCTIAGPTVNAYVTFDSLPECLKYIWKVNGKVQSDSGTTLTYIVTANGVYEVCVKVKDTCNNCDTSFCVARTITCFSGIAQPKAEIDQITIYPNPNNGQFMLESPSAILSYTIYGVSGKVIRQVSVNALKQTIDMGDVAGGIYYIKLYTKNGVVSQKLVVNKE